MIDPNAQPIEGTLEERIIEALRTIYDPELPVNIFDLGLIYEIDTSNERETRIVMTLTAPNCPVAESLPGQVEHVTRDVEGVPAARVELTWDPKWTPDRLSDAAKLELEFTGHTGPIGGPRMTGLTMGRRNIGERPDPRG